MAKKWNIEKKKDFNKIEILKTLKILNKNFI